ncbi:MAG: MerR family transcriptional regulator [Pseudomonadota bacterium]
MNASQQPRQFSISALAEEFDVTTRTLRFYEEKGLLTPERRGRVRYFSAADRVRLRLILRGRRLGLTLEQSAEIIDLYREPEGSKRQLQRLLDTLADRREQLQRQSEDIAQTLKDLADVEDKCRAAME